MPQIITRLNYFRKKAEDSETILEKKFRDHLSSLKMNKEEYFLWCENNNLSVKFEKKNELKLKKEIVLFKKLSFNNTLDISNKVKKVKKRSDFISNLFSLDELDKELLNIKDEVLLYQKKDRNFLNFLKRLDKKVKLNNFILSTFKRKSQISKISFLYRVYENNSLFIREVEDINLSEKFSYKDIVNHFFVKYNDFSSDLIYSFWLMSGNYYMCHLNISQGYKVFNEFTKYFPYLYWTKKEVLNCLKKEDDNFKKVIIKNIVKKYKGDISLVETIMKIPNLNLFILENSHYKVDYRLDDYIFLLTRKNNDFFEKTQIQPVWDYIIENNISQLRKRSLYKLFLDMCDWHEELAKENGNLKYITWNSSGIENYYLLDDDKNLVLEITEILDNYELKSEGKELKHCVYSYVNRCKSYQASIFSLKKRNIKGKMKRALTIEVRGEKIVQIKGKCNSFPSNIDLKIIEKWANENCMIIERRNYYGI